MEEVQRRLKQEKQKIQEESHTGILEDAGGERGGAAGGRPTGLAADDHPNHTVTVSTVSRLALSCVRLLRLPPPEHWAGRWSKEAASSTEKPARALPRKSRDPPAASHGIATRAVAKRSRETFA
ncbi:hypothetical protein HPG69_019518 [Diceros bicornis minor]|uniref:Uncharacterized protein n=1 Tax=Diceros bicornis minor TaxID=77932 RepID=A0A7J7E658_DICBM|nr:hypothetical protein HPG69_019518 [Diceros bicornis minor]